MGGVLTKDEWIEITQSEDYKNQFNDLVSSYNMLYRKLDFDTMSALLDNLNTTFTSDEPKSSNELHVEKEAAKQLESVYGGSRAFFDSICNQLHEPLFEEKQLIEICCRIFRIALSDNLENSNYNRDGKIILDEDKYGDVVLRTEISISEPSISNAINLLISNEILSENIFKTVSSVKDTLAQLRKTGEDDSSEQNSPKIR